MEGVEIALLHQPWCLYQVTTQYRQLAARGRGVARGLERSARARRCRRCLMIGRHSDARLKGSNEAIAIPVQGPDDPLRAPTIPHRLAYSHDGIFHHRIADVLLWPELRGEFLFRDHPVTVLH